MVDHVVLIVRLILNLPLLILHEDPIDLRLLKLCEEASLLLSVLLDVKFA